MQYYCGTKAIKAKPMNRLEYNQYRGWDLPADENGAGEGYLVEHLDGGKSNHPGHEGYISWSPKEQFENTYQATGALSVGHALKAIEKGLKVRRAAWPENWLYLTNDTYLMLKIEGCEELSNYDPHVDDLTHADWQILTD